MLQQSTLVKALAGAITLDSGEFLVDGQAVQFHHTADARKAGIAVIFQEPTLFGDLSITENIYMGTRNRQCVSTRPHTVSPSHRRAAW